MKEEKWRDIPGYEGVYAASNLGNIKAYTKDVYLPHHGYKPYAEKMLSQYLNPRGYLHVALSKKQKG